ncbi:MAG: shikimate kinase AroK [Gammaproteobacteria bacterium]
MYKPENIFLVGPMGAGKSTVGRKLAAILEKEFLDSDEVIEVKTGASISLIFEIEGEQGFRRREHRVLDELTRRKGIVLATGGGVVLEKKNRISLRSRGFVIYLNPPFERLVERTMKDRRRPLLQTENPQARLRAIVTERDALYRQVADMIVSGEHRTPAHVVRDILAEFSRL